MHKRAYSICILVLGLQIACSADEENQKTSPNFGTSNQDENVNAGQDDSDDEENASSDFPSDYTVALNLTSDKTVSIPGDYDSLQDAFDEESRYRANGYRLIVNIESEHQISSGLNLKDGDYSHFTIACDDEVVFVSDSFSEDEHLFLGSNVRMPVLNCLFDMQGKGENGYYIYSASQGVIKNDAGVINAGSNGLYANRGSTVEAHHTDFSGAGKMGIWADHGSTITAQGATVSNAQDHGVFALEASRIDFRHGTSLNVGGHGIQARRASQINARDADASGATKDGVRAIEGSTISARNIVAENVGMNGIRAHGGSTIDARDAQANHSGASGIRATQTSSVDARRAEVKNSSDEAVRASQMSKVNFLDGDAGDDEIAVHAGSFISLGGDWSGQTNININELTGAGIIFD